MRIYMDDIEAFIEEKASYHQLQLIQDLAYKEMKSIDRISKNPTDNDFKMLEAKDSNGVVLHLEENTQSIVIESPKQEDLNEILSCYGYKKSENYYTKWMGKYNGEIDDRVAEIVYLLLTKGYSIKLDVSNFDKIKSKVEQGAFTKDVRQIVGYDADKKLFKVAWYGFRKDIYDSAKSIGGARWDSLYKLVTIPYEQHLAVEDFAEKFDCFITPEAKKAFKLLTDTTIHIRDDYKQEDINNMIDIPEDLLDD